MWMICEDDKISLESKQLAYVFDDLGMCTSDVDPVKSIHDVYEIATSLDKGIMPSKKLPLDVHIIEYSKVEELLNKIVPTFIKATSNSIAPYLAIHPLSLRKKWQYDDVAYNFAFDYLFSLTPFSWEDDLNNKLMKSRFELRSLFSENDLIEIFDLVASDSVKKSKKMLWKKVKIMGRKIDLHIHTNKSDGVLTPFEVIDEAYNNGVSVIAIADHDTIDAYNDELFEYAKARNITIIPAVEISTKINKCGIHVLGYNFDLNNNTLREKLKKLRNARHDYLYNVAAKLNKLGYVVNCSSLDKIDAVTKAHISLDVITNEQNRELLLKEFGHIPGKGEFIETVMNEGCRAYVKKETITPVEASQLIKKASGKVVLAHPVAYKYEDNLTEADILKLVKDMEIDAIEGNYIYVDRNNQRIDECAEWCKFARENNLICTIGSDFHNDDGIRPIIGLGNDKITLSNEDIEKILNYLLG